MHALGFSVYDRRSIHFQIMMMTVMMMSGTKETAFVHAVTSAGVVHAVTTACSAGNLTDCTCDMHPGGRGGVGPSPTGHVPGVPGGLGNDGWRWGGCSDNVMYGVWFTMVFVDAAERLKVGPRTAHFSVVRGGRAVSDEIKALVNLHNNEVGRKVVSHISSVACAPKSLQSSSSLFNSLKAKTQSK